MKDKKQQSKKIQVFRLILLLIQLVCNILPLIEKDNSTKRV